MEKLTIHIPDTKSNIVKHILHSLGVDIQGLKSPVKGNYKQKLVRVSEWSDEDVKPIEESRKQFDNFGAEEW